MKAAAGFDIPKLRTSHGISQALLSAKSGINRYRLSQLECGYDEPTDDERTSLVAALLSLVKEKAAAFYAALNELSNEKVPPRHARRRGPKEMTYASVDPNILNFATDFNPPSCPPA